VECWLGIGRSSRAQRQGEREEPGIGLSLGDDRARARRGGHCMSGDRSRPRASQSQSAASPPLDPVPPPQNAPQNATRYPELNLNPNQPSTMSQQKNGSILSFFKPSGASTPARPQSSASNSGSAQKSATRPKAAVMSTPKSSGVINSSSPAPSRGPKTPLTARPSNLTSEAELMTLDEEPSSPEPVVSDWSDRLMNMGEGVDGWTDWEMISRSLLVCGDLTRRRALWLS